MRRCKDLNLGSGVFKENIVLRPCRGNEQNLKNTSFMYMLRSELQDWKFQNLGSIIFSERTMSSHSTYQKLEANQLMASASINC